MSQDHHDRFYCLHLIFCIFCYLQGPASVHMSTGTSKTFSHRELTRHSVVLHHQVHDRQDDHLPHPPDRLGEGEVEFQLSKRSCVLLCEGGGDFLSSGKMSLAQVRNSIDVHDEGSLSSCHRCRHITVQRC